MRHQAPTRWQSILASADARLATALSEGVRRASHRGQPIVVSVVEAISPLDAISLFRAAEGAGLFRSFWARPGRTLTVVGIGEAHPIKVNGVDRFTAADRARERLQREALIVRFDDIPDLVPTGPLLMGGFSFFPSRESERAATTDTIFQGGASVRRLWASFPDGLLTIPRIVYTQTEQGAWLSHNVVVSADADPHALEEEIVAFAAAVLPRSYGSGASDLTAGAPSISATGNVSGSAAGSRSGSASASPENASEFALRNLSGNTSETPLESFSGGVLPADSLPVEAGDQEGAAWKALVASAKAAIDAGDFEKVVLARQVDVAHPLPFCAASALAALERAYPECFIFAYTVNEETFLGATPERLATLSGERVEVMCLAGSAPRGETPSSDRALGEALLKDHKNRVEHNLVVEMVRSALKEIVSPLEAPSEPTLLKLPNVQHLCTPVVGHLTEATSIFSLLEALHPTPAVGGHPKLPSLDWLQLHEGFDRGWYAAPVGWTSLNGDGEYAVAIRSALVRGDKATLFAGCGIVADSVADDEYEESRLKLLPMWRALMGSVQP